MVQKPTLPLKISRRALALGRSGSAFEAQLAIPQVRAINCRDVPTNERECTVTMSW